MTKTDLTIRVVPGLQQVAADAWNLCAQGKVEIRSNFESLSTAAPAQFEPGPKPQKAADLARTDAYNPFISHEFLSALEDSDSVGGRTGWQPRHLLAETGGGMLIGAVPCYLKSHSRGEYVFDRNWAEAYERAGGRYYPKLQVSVPFTPVTGRRLLLRANAPAILPDRLASALIQTCGLTETSSVHLTFLTEAEGRFLTTRGFLQRTDQQFHWKNEGYRSFEDFLSALASRKRKAIKRERREALAAGISVHWLVGSDLTEAAWDAFFDFYMETGSRKWGRPYLTRRFYSLIGQSMADKVVLMMAKRAGRYIAGAINFIGSDTLFGRHWGAIEHHQFLHFEICYYQAIEFAIRHRMKRVEAGAQGEHKLARGYLPITTYSAHFIADPALRRAVADYLQHERAYMAAAGEELAALAPFRKNLVLGRV